MKKYFIVLLLFLSAISSINAQIGQPLPKWEKGLLDIHFINTGRGNCQYIVLPDGTTMMTDIGGLSSKGFSKKYYPMECSPAFPDSTQSPAQVAAHYISLMQAGQDKDIDYMLITHFHSDHYGYITSNSPLAPKGDYRMSGVTELAQYIPIHKIVDRGWPKYDFPLAMRNRLKPDGSEADPTFDNYLKFLDYQIHANKMKVEQLALGSTQQFALLNHPKDYPTCYVRGIKQSNMIWTGKGTGSRELFPASVVVDEKGNYNENPLSCAIVLKYGKFSFYSGGDNTGLEDQDHPSWMDVETPMAGLIGKVSALTLDHHGNRDATNLTFLKSLDPQVVISQSWCSDHPGQEVGHRLISPNLGSHQREIYMTHYDPKTGIGIGMWFERKLTQRQGHYVIRVYPDSSFVVYTLDCTKEDPTILAVSKKFYAE